MLASDVIDRARLAINDQDEANYRWPNETMLIYLNDAIQDAASRRPELTLTEGGATVDFPTVMELTDSIGLDAHLTPALADYVAHRALGSDDADTANATMAAEHFERYLLVLHGG